MRRQLLVAGVVAHLAITDVLCLAPTAADLRRVDIFRLEETIGSSFPVMKYVIVDPTSCHT